MFDSIRLVRCSIYKTLETFQIYKKRHRELRMDTIIYNKRLRRTVCTAPARPLTRSGGRAAAWAPCRRGRARARGRGRGRARGRGRGRATRAQPEEVGAVAQRPARERRAAAARLEVPIAAAVQLLVGRHAEAHHQVQLAAQQHRHPEQVEAGVGGHPGHPRVAARPRRASTCSG
jgi:hypothetical protein